MISNREQILIYSDLNSLSSNGQVLLVVYALVIFTIKPAKLLDNRNKMKTRNQAKNERQKVPKLNEDVFGIILKHVIQREQVKVKSSFVFIGNHFGGCENCLLDNFCPCDRNKSLGNCIFTIDEGLDDNVQWPRQLKSNSQRLVYHTKIKLLSNTYCENELPLSVLISSEEELDMIWETFKHFAYILNRHQSMKRGIMSPTEFVQELRDHLDTRQTRSWCLIQLLE